MAIQIQRREVIYALGGIAAAWPLASHAQKSERVRRIGILMATSSDDPEGKSRLVAIAQGLQKFGWTEGSNVHTEVRSSGDDADLSRRYAEELVALAPDVLVASASLKVAALQRATRSVPIVFANIIDPVGAGFVRTLAHPGGNTTGFTSFEYSMCGKWLELLKKLAPQTTRIAVLRDPGYTTGIGQFAAIQSAASSSSGIELSVIDSRDVNEIERELATFGPEPNGGVIVAGSPSAAAHRKLIISLLTHYRLAR
jgi:putative ABC transport system substrate-binding protein